MTEQTDIKSIPFLVDDSEYVTEEQAREYLTAGGYADEAGQMFAGARKFPMSFRYTADRHRYLAHVLVHGGWHWVAGDCTRSEERIKALGRSRLGARTLTTEEAGHRG